MNLFLGQHISASSCRAKQKKEEADKKAAEADTKKKRHANKTMKTGKQRVTKACMAESLEKKVLGVTEKICVLADF